MGINHVDTHTYNVLSLCSGIGGLDLGTRISVPNARTICYVEREAYPCAVLVKRMEEALLDDAPIWSDINTFQGLPWRGIVDILIASYPCQPFSLGGKRQGAGDSRHLWPEVKRIISEVQPGTVFMENVAGHLSLGFENVVSDLLGLGYNCAAGLFSAQEVGAPHRRDRLFVLAHTGSRGWVQCAGQSREGDGHQEGDIYHWPQEPPGSRMAYGVPAGVQRNRALGASVLPLQAAYALKVLNEKFLQG